MTGVHMIASMPPPPARHGRPPRDLGGTTNTTMRIPTPIHERLVKVADDRMISRGMIVARALEAFLPRLENDAT